MSAAEQPRSPLQDYRDNQETAVPTPVREEPDTEAPPTIQDGGRS